jgi:hypothetical protein
LIPNPIHKVLSTLTSRQVQYLLMGGQACVLYGAAQFSKDTDIAVLAEAENLKKLEQAVEDLQAACIAVPPFEASYLERGHAVHFRCQHPEAQGIRLDVMSVLRGVAPFAELWERRATVALDSGLVIEVMALPDLVKAKKTQRDKDWVMLRRLLEAHYVRYRDNPNTDLAMFWLQEVRTGALLLQLATRFPDPLVRVLPTRPLLSAAAAQDESALQAALEMEERAERAADRQYWLPLRQELEALRHKKPKYRDRSR